MRPLTHSPGAGGSPFPNRRGTPAPWGVPQGAAGPPGGTMQPLWSAPPQPPPSVPASLAASRCPGGAEPPSSSDRQPPPCPAPSRAQTQGTAPYLAPSRSGSSSAPGMRLAELPPRRGPGGGGEKARRGLRRGSRWRRGEDAGGSRAGPAAVRGGGERRRPRAPAPAARPAAPCPAFRTPPPRRLSAFPTRVPLPRLPSALQPWVPSLPLVALGPV